MSSGRYIKRSASLLVSILAAVALFNAVVDPYDVVGTPRIAGFNSVKPYTAQFTHLIKPYQVARVHPTTLLLGSSRVDIGIDPDGDAWPKALQPVYDFGLPGTDVLMLYRALQHTQAIAPIKLAVVALDFEPFLTPADPGGDAAEGRRLMVERDGAPNPLQPLQHAQDLVAVTLTMSATVHSIGTVLGQHDRVTPDLSAHGSTSEGGFQRTAMSDGYGTMFAQKDVDYAKRTNHYAEGLHSLGADRSNIDIVRQMIDFCREHGIRLILLIPPHHADLLEIYDASGVWDRFESWKADLTRLVAQDGGPQTTLWDFSGYDQYATEAPPSRGDHAATRWFWEPGHFKKALGSLIVSRILTGEPANFGVELTPQTIDAQLARIRQDRQTYRETQAAQVTRLSATIDHPSPFANAD